MTASLIINLSTSIVIAIGLAILGYLKNKPDGEEFDKIKFITRITFGIVTGIIIYITNTPINEENITVIIASNAGLLIIIEYIVKIVYKNMIQQSNENPIKKD